MSMTLHIERLVLDGLSLSAGQGRLFRAALEQELMRLLPERDLQLLSSGAMPQLSVAPIQLAASGQPAQWARQIARSVCDGLAPVSSLAASGQNIPAAHTPARPNGTHAPRLSVAKPTVS